MRVALFQPDIPQNTGTILRLASCLGVPVDIIGPAGFDMSDRALRRAGLDYLDRAAFALHADYPAFLNHRRAAGDGRLLLATTKAETSYLDLSFRPDDVLLFGRESAGAPDWLHLEADARIRIPLLPPARSLNLAVATAMVLGEALRQTGGFAAPTP